MATTNYSLPMLESTALFDLVTDYNALANATDAALASVAGLIPTESITEMQGQISALQTLTGSQGTQITTLQSQMSTANGNISTLQSGLETANNNIGTLQTGLQGANETAQQALNTINAGAQPVKLLNKVNVSVNNGGTYLVTVIHNPLAKTITVSASGSNSGNRTTIGKSVDATAKVPGYNHPEYAPSRLIRIPLTTSFVIGGSMFSVYAQVGNDGTLNIGVSSGSTAPGEVIASGSCSWQYGVTE